MKIRTKNAPMLRVPSTSARHHQMPFGSRGRNASRRRPNGSARTMAPKSGRSGGRNVSVT